MSDTKGWRLDKALAGGGELMGMQVFIACRDAAYTQVQANCRSGTGNA